MTTMTDTPAVPPGTIYTPTGYHVSVHTTGKGGECESIFFHRPTMSAVIKKLAELEMDVEKRELYPIRDVEIEWKD